MGARSSKAGTWAVTALLVVLGLVIGPLVVLLVFALYGLVICPASSALGPLVDGGGECGFGWTGPLVLLASPFIGVFGVLALAGKVSERREWKRRAATRAAERAARSDNG